MKKTGGGPPLQDYTSDEELALSFNDGRPLADRIEGRSRQSLLEVSASNRQHLYTVCVSESVLNYGLLIKDQYKAHSTVNKS